MKILQLGLRSARLLTPACRPETLHDALAVTQRAMTVPCQSRHDPLETLAGFRSLKDAPSARMWFGTSSAHLQQCLFDENIDIPVQCRLTAVLHTPTDVNVSTGPMERLQLQVNGDCAAWPQTLGFLLLLSLSLVVDNLQVTCEDPLESNADSYVLHIGKDNSVGSIPALCMRLPSNAAEAPCLELRR